MPASPLFWSFAVAESFQEFVRHYAKNDDHSEGPVHSVIKCLTERHRSDCYRIGRARSRSRPNARPNARWLGKGEGNQLANRSKLARDLREITEILVKVVGMLWKNADDGHDFADVRRRRVNAIMSPASSIDSINQCNLYLTGLAVHTYRTAQPNSFSIIRLNGGRPFRRTAWKSCWERWLPSLEG